MPEQSKGESELYCFLNSERACGADCMAYVTVPRENKELDELQPHCVLIDSAARSAHGLHVLAAVFGTWMKDSRRREADSKRASSEATTPPDPMGTKK